MNHIRAAVAAIALAGTVWPTPGIHSRLVTTTYTALAVAVSRIEAHGAYDGASVASGPTYSIVKPPDADGVVTLVEDGRVDASTATIAANTIFVSICSHCDLKMCVPREGLLKRCSVCPCGATFAECLTDRAPKRGDWAAVVGMLPKGTACRLEWVDADHHESGLKQITVDRRTVLLPVDGLAQSDSGALKALVQPVGGSDPALTANATRLRFRVKSAWTADREAQLEKLLARVNARVRAPEMQAAAR